MAKMVSIPRRLTRKNKIALAGIEQFSNWFDDMPEEQILGHAIWMKQDMGNRINNQAKFLQAHTKDSILDILIKLNIEKPIPQDEITQEEYENLLVEMGI